MAAGAAPKQVYYPLNSPEEWLVGQLVKEEANGTAVVKIDGREHNVPADKAHLLLPPHGTHAKEPPHRSLEKQAGPDFGAAVAEEQIRENFCDGYMYTGLGDTTLAVNPFKELDIHSDSWIGKYSGLDPALPPHIFASAARAHAQLLDTSQDQAIIFLGEVASGKSRAFRHVMDYMLNTAVGEDSLEELVKVLHRLIHPLVSIMTSEGKEGTSTRALLEVQFAIADDGFASSAAASVRLLEASRVARHASPCGNFDALYLAVKDPLAKKWVKHSEFKILGGHRPDAAHENEALRTWSMAVQAFHIEWEDVVRALCGVVLLGEVIAVDHGAAAPSLEPADALPAAAAALGIGEAELRAAILGAPGAAKADGCTAILAATLEDIYRRLVRWVVNVANDKMKGDGKPHTTQIRLVEVPAQLEKPEDLPSGFEQLQVFWLQEGVQADLLHGALAGPLHDGPAVADHSAECHAAASALDAIAALVHEELASLADADDHKAQESLAKWATAHGPPISDIKPPPKASCRISGAAGALPALALGAALAHAAVGNVAPAKVVELLAKSSCSAVAAAYKRNTAPTGTKDVEQALLDVCGPLRGERCRPWLVCCMRPNAKLDEKSVHKSELLRQVRHFRVVDLAHMLHPAKDGALNTVWSVAEFRKKYARLSPAAKPEVADREACQHIIDAAGLGKGAGTVGPEGVYGTAGLQKALEAKLGSAGAAQAVEQPGKPQAAAKQQPQPPSPQPHHPDEQPKPQPQPAPHPHQPEEKPKPPPQSASQPHEHDLQRQLEEQRQLLQKQQEQIQRQHEEQQHYMAEQQKRLNQMDAFFKDKLHRQQQEHHAELQALKDKRKDHSSPTAPKLGATATQEVPRSVEFQHMEDMLQNLSQAHKALASKAWLHTSLARMAAVMRVSREQEELHQEEMEALRQECETWRMEADRLWQQVQDLQRQLRERR